MDTKYSIVVERFRQRMQSVRIHRGMNQGDLAGPLGVHQTTVAKMESSAGRHIRLVEALAICDALGVTLEQMLGDDPVQVTVTVDS